MNHKKKKKKIGWVFLLLLFLPISYFSYQYVEISRLPLSLQKGWTGEMESENAFSLRAVQLERKGSHALYANRISGYQVTYPSNWNIDIHQPSVYTRFFGQDFRIDVTHQDIGAFYTEEEFLSLLLAPIKKNIQHQKKWRNKGFRFVEVDYERTPLYEQDLTRYRYVFMMKNNQMYVFQLKTNKENWKKRTAELQMVIESFTSSSVTAFPVSFASGNPDMAIQYGTGNHQLSIPSKQFISGTFKQNEEDIDQVEKELNGQFGAQMYYYNFDSHKYEHIKETVQKGRVPLISIQFYKMKNETRIPNIQEVIQGNYDLKIMEMAYSFKMLKKPLFIRIGNEMNGDWVDWSHKDIYNDPDLFKLAYQRIVDIFREVGAENVQFVWNPNNTSRPYGNWNHAAIYYPGDQYVDWIGLTAYNYGDTDYGVFKSFDDLYEPLYEETLSLYAHKPIMITEFASAEKGGNKAQFIRDAYQNLPLKYPHVKMVIWFNEQDGMFEFPVDSSNESKKAFQETFEYDWVVKTPYDMK